MDALVSWGSGSKLGRRQREAVNGAIPQVVASVRGWVHGGPHGTGRRWNLSFDAEGRFGNASPGARAWLTPREADELGAWVRRIDGGRGEVVSIARGLLAEALRPRRDPPGRSRRTEDSRRDRELLGHGI